MPDGFNGILDLAAGTSTQWAVSSVVPPVGYYCYESDTNKGKLADGVHVYSLLPYASQQLVPSSSITNLLINQGFTDSNLSSFQSSAAPNLSTSGITSTFGAVVTLDMLIGNLSTLQTSAKDSVVHAINELVIALNSAGSGSIGNLSALITSVKNSIVGALNSEVSRAGTAETALSTEIGTLANLTTSDKTSVVNALNSIVTALTAEITRATGVEVANQNSIGTLANLATSDKTSVVNAVNAEVTARGTAVTAVTNIIGVLSGLTTTAKNTVVAAINELLSDISATNSVIGSLSGLTTTAKGNVVAALNEAVADVNTEVNRAEAAEATLTSTIGNLTNLTTSNKTSVVNAVNAEAARASGAETTLSSSIGTLSSLTTAAKASLVASINETNLIATSNPGSTGTDWSVSAPTVPNLGAAFPGTGPYPSYVRIALIPANASRLNIDVENASGQRIVIIRDDGTGTSTLNKASMFPLDPGGVAGEGGSWTSTTFKGRLQIYAPVALSGNAYVSVMED